MFAYTYEAIMYTEVNALLALSETRAQCGHFVHGEFPNDGGKDNISP